MKLKSDTNLQYESFVAANDSNKKLGRIPVDLTKVSSQIIEQSILENDSKMSKIEVALRPKIDGKAQEHSPKPVAIALPKWTRS